MVVKHTICVILFIVILYPSSLFRKEEEEMGMVVERGFKLILGSQWMARKKILGEMGYDFTIVTADIDEKAIRRDNPQDLVVALAQAKADEIISKLGGQSQFAQDPLPTLLITADTVIVYKGVIREKPISKEEARQFIKGYSGSHGSVVGSVIVSNLKTGVQRAGWDKAEVYFHEIPAKVIDDLIDDSITFKVAGGLTLEHPLISPFIDTVVGGVDTVMGLPKELTEKFITDAL
ncbi:PREDICTED: maf-like protein DDB_G0281937 isoform X2 [Brassica oleracea var. oleracea]|uniref:maf-like protein DDB_G0281937 isoform X2 n=1 Tax=Brassica oleracea var. oleracea TaxID=109376 RepID=UPI0006A726DB|nr:PREDICTED: maf-like protein DDB_G0281937 isoform X2 [Brassica oleracea var. oleracea]